MFSIHKLITHNRFNRLLNNSLYLFKYPKSICNHNVQCSLNSYNDNLKYCNSHHQLILSHRQVNVNNHSKLFHNFGTVCDKHKDDNNNNNVNNTKIDYLSGSIASNLVNILPKSIQAHARLMRLDKPTGTWLLLLPGWWSIGLSTAPGALPPLDLMFLFGIGAVLMRASGCIINDIWDRKFDQKVMRTRTRPLASKEISMNDAVALLSSLLSLSLLILVKFDLSSIILGASSLLFVGIYPAFKRFTYWPQLVLGMTFNWGALLGWSVNTGGSLNLAAVLSLYFAGINWTLIYDTIYAHQDKKDDFVLGLKSTALKFGSDTSKYLKIFTTLMTLSLVNVGIVCDQTLPYYISILISTLFLLRINQKLNINSVKSCAIAFRQNTQIGWILLIGIIIGTLMKKQSSIDESPKIIDNENQNTK